MLASPVEGWWCACLNVPVLPSPEHCLQGRDRYGTYMRDVLRAEGVRQVEPVADGELTPELDQTLLCFVLVAPDGRHAFCRCGADTVVTRRPAGRLPQASATGGCLGMQQASLSMRLAVRWRCQALQNSRAHVP